MNLMGIDMTRGLKATLFMTNIDGAEVVLKVWLEECNWKEYPALTLAQVSALPHGAQMQVDLIAAAGRCNTKFSLIGQNRLAPCLPCPRRRVKRQGTVKETGCSPEDVTDECNAGEVGIQEAP